MAAGTADQEGEANVYINIGIIDVTNPVADRVCEGNLYFNVGVIDLTNPLPFREGEGWLYFNAMSDILFLTRNLSGWSFGEDLTGDQTEYLWTAAEGVANIYFNVTP